MPADWAGTGPAPRRSVTAPGRETPAGLRPSRAAAVARQVGGERRRRRLHIAAIGEDLDAAFGFFQPCVAEARQLHAALVVGKRLLERHVALLELFHDRFELGNRGLEVFDRCLHSPLYPAVAPR